VKTLSIKQPWAWAILAAGKDVENRTWMTSYRGPLFVHAGLRPAPEGETWIETRLGLVIPDDLPKGGIVGTVILEDVIEDSTSPWAMDGHYHWILSNPRVLPLAPVKGKLGLFETTHADV
jgi:ASCH domain